MTEHDKQTLTSSDPLGLRELDMVEPGYDGWSQIESALETHKTGKRRWQRHGAWLAVAASLVLVISVAVFNTQRTSIELSSPEFATPVVNPASVTMKDNINALIGLSQSMEEPVTQLRMETGSMPAESAIYVAELEDLIAQVDSGLSVTPDSIDLWGQRVNLMLDLAQIYQQQWEIDYGRMASL
ncbi:MAG: hypothetical protein WBM36_10825 [Lysobacterales bacterium]